MSAGRDYDQELAVLAERLLEGCTRARGREDEPPWVTALRASPSAIATALRGRPLTVEVTTDKCGPVRVAFLANGVVLYRIERQGELDARLTGSEHDIARFVLGDDVLLSGELDGVLEVLNQHGRQGLARLRQAASALLRRAFEGPAAIAIMVRRETRVRHITSEGAAFTMLAERAAPLFLAACSMLSPVAAAATGPNGQPSPASAQPPPMVSVNGTSAPSLKSSTPDASTERDRPRPQPASAPTQPTAETPTIEKRAEVGDRTAFIEVSCDHRLAVTACGVLSSADPTAAPVPLP